MCFFSLVFLIFLTNYEPHTQSDDINELRRQTSKRLHSVVAIALKLKSYEHLNKKMEKFWVITFSFFKISYIKNSCDVSKHIY